jgi:protein nanos 1
MFNMDLIKHLDSLVESPCDGNKMDDEDGPLSVNINFNQESDCYLETIRSDAFEEFSKNGIEQDLDEVDLFQSKLRERTTTPATRPINPEPSYNPVAVEYMNQKRRRSKKKASKTVCVFCKNNNEQPQVYQSHVLKDAEGRTTCPILRKYTCPICGVRGGDEAHTIR